MPKWLKWLDERLSRKIPTPRIPSEEVGRVKRIGLVAYFVWAIGFLLIALALGLFYLFVFGAPSFLTNPGLQYAIPTAVPTLVERTIADPFKDTQWLSQGDAAALRGRLNVVNLAMLEDGGAKYSNLTVNFDSTDAAWEKTKPAGVTTLTVRGTTFEMTQGVDTYHLNLLQPFVFASSKTIVYVVDPTGMVWQRSAQGLVLIPALQVKLPIQIAPNPDLSFTY